MYSSSLLPAAFLVGALAQSSTSLRSTSSMTSVSDPYTTVGPVYNGTTLNLHFGGLPAQRNASVIAADSVSTTWAVTCKLSRIVDPTGYLLDPACPPQPLTLTQSGGNYQYSYVQQVTTNQVTIRPDGEPGYSTSVLTVTQSYAFSLTVGADNKTSYAYVYSGTSELGTAVAAVVTATSAWSAITVTAGTEKLKAASTVSRTATDTLSFDALARAQTVTVTATATGTANTSKASNAAGGRLSPPGVESRGVLLSMTCAVGLVAALAALL